MQLVRVHSHSLHKVLSVHLGDLWQLRRRKLVVLRLHSRDRGLLVAALLLNLGVFHYHLVILRELILELIVLWLLLGGSGL